MCFRFAPGRRLEAVGASESAARIHINGLARSESTVGLPVCYTAHRKQNGSPMTVLVKRSSLNVPVAVTKKAGIRPGDLVEFTARRGTITIRTATLPNESRYPLYTPTKAEAAAIRKGRAAYKRGDYVTLGQLHDGLDAAR